VESEARRAFRARRDWLLQSEADIGEDGVAGGGPDGRELDDQSLRVAGELELLEDFLTRADFGALRAAHPELTGGGERVEVEISRLSDGEPTLTDVATGKSLAWV
jgi:hypothetical protein